MSKEENTHLLYSMCPQTVAGYVYVGYIRLPVATPLTKLGPYIMELVRARMVSLSDEPAESVEAQAGGLQCMLH